jgi:hypothetical protein
MVTRSMRLVSDNVFASNDLFELLERNRGLLWISRAVRYWQREQFIRPELITPEVRQMLKKIDIQGLTNQERIIYLAYLENGPVKYTRIESLMAVLGNDLDQTGYSEQLTTIFQMIDWSTD